MISTSRREKAQGGQRHVCDTFRSRLACIGVEGGHGKKLGVAARATHCAEGADLEKIARSLSEIIRISGLSINFNCESQISKV